jgi:Baseplate J-like protein
MSAMKDRRQQLLSQSPAVLNGIDYVVVARPRKTAIEVHFLTAAPLAKTATSATITGGQTIPTIAITSMVWSTDSRNQPSLTINVAAPGDSSSYILSLSNAALDPYYSEFRFSFDAGDPSTLDCELPAPVAPMPPASGPPIDYLAKDFLSFREALSDFSTLKYPAWQERSEADFGVMFMEALCALGDDLSYQQDRIAAEAYLDTATERLSIVRHARLVDYEPKPALAANVLLQFAVTATTATIPAGMAVSVAGPDGSAINFETGTGLADTRQYQVDPAWNAITPYWWDETDRILPAGTTEMWVVSHGLALQAGDRLSLDTVPAEEGLPNIRELVWIGSADEQTDQLYNVPITHIMFQQPTTEQHNLDATTVRGNLIPATQGLRHTESFAIGNGTTGVPLAITRTGPNQTPQYLYTLGNAPLTWLVPGNDTAAAPTPEILLAQQPVSVSGAATGWTWYRSLLDAPAFALGFTIDPVRYAQLPSDLAGGIFQSDYDGSNGDTLRFGDGDFGEIPPDDAAFTVTYRAGGGALGNVAADSITTIDPTGPLARLASAVTNPFAAQGGADAEPNDTVVRLAPNAYKSAQFNAALPADYVTAAERLPWVKSAGCTVHHTGSWLTTFTVAEPVATEFPTYDQSRELTALIDRYRLVGRESYVLPPTYVSLDLRIAVSASRDVFRGNVAAAVTQALGTGTLPNGRAGFFAHGQFTFGQPLTRSALEAAIQTALGVAGVISIRFRRHGSTAPFVEMTDQVQVGIDEIVRVDNDPRRPGAGSISLTVAGGK